VAALAPAPGEHDSDLATPVRPPLGKRGARELALMSTDARRGSEPRRPIDPMVAVGDSIGRYVVLRRIGAGGMGAVYRARDRRLDRRVALKLGLRGTDLARARREAVALARLAHPNVVTIHEVGEHAGAPFVAMELCTGGTARAWVRDRPWREVLGLYLAAGRGLAAAHAAGLVHRDVKPDNLVLSREREQLRVKVVDFGLARETKTEAPSESGGAISSVSILMGTPGYIAIELVAGADATPASDQWAIAATGIELLTGVRLKFEKPDTALRTVVEEVVSVVSTVASGVPVTYARSLAKAMACDPDDRWVNVLALRRALYRSAGGRLPGDDEVRFEVLRNGR